MQSNAQTRPAGQQQSTAPAQATPQTAPQPPKPVPPAEFQSEKIDALDERALISILNDSAATTFQKAKACQRLARIGGKEAVPAVAPLLGDPKLSAYARNTLQSIPDPSSDEALRNALPKLKGTLLIGVINSIGYRKDRNASAALARLLADRDPGVAQASAATLGHMGGAQAASTLRDALGRTKGPMRAAVADACLLCAEELLSEGERDEAMSLYNTLTATDVPKPARLAAMHGIIAAETSLNRPR